MLAQASLNATYWSSAFKVTKNDIEYLFNLFLEREKPISRQDLARAIIAVRLKEQRDALRKQMERGEIYQPKQSYQVGQEVIFPAFDYAVGRVVGTRAGSNGENGEFGVIEVEFENQKRREFAAELATHALNAVAGEAPPLPNAAQAPTVESIYDEHGEMIIDEIEAKLVDEDDAISFGDDWFLRSLMIEVNIGHLNLAEALLVMNEGGPLATEVLLPDLDLTQLVDQAIATFSLNVALSNDERFDDVGAAGRVEWFHRDYEPEAVLTAPERLLYKTLEYDPAVLTDELRAIEREIDDELSPFETVTPAPTEATLTLNYGHRRCGTLPLTSKVRGMFPTSFESPRILVKLVDEQTGESFSGWVVHDYQYVYGLWEFYSRYKLPIGGYLTLKATDNLSQLTLSFQNYKPRSEYIRLAIPNGNRLTFSNHKRQVGAPYDDLLIVGAEDIKGVDAIWKYTADRKRGLVEIMKDLIPELAKLNPQNAVHAKTLYAAVNVVKRCPPGPIFATLVTRDEFEHIGGPYWRLKATNQGD